MNLLVRITYRFSGNVIKYVCRYMNKNGIEDLDKIIHYCELEKKKMKDLNAEQQNNSKTNKRR
jgi:hypothetical protein